MGVALLAPVPAVFMTSALEIAEREGSVAFGTKAFEFFVKLFRRGRHYDQATSCNLTCSHAPY